MIEMNKQHDEVLLILQEECAELIQAICKVKRFGLQENKENLLQEIADVLCMINLVYDKGVLEKDEDMLRERITVKAERLKIYSDIFKT
jgi:NTP pyrophosphatase (non-canonical NTP hydrolase)